jgi:uncharacterized DUF497 family protein
VHGVAPAEAEYVIEHAKPPCPSDAGDEKFEVRGQTDSGYYLIVIYVVDEDGTIFVIHPRPMKVSEKRQYRRRKR